MLHTHLRAALLALVVLGSGSVLAQENLELGKMWTLHDPPLGYLEEEYGFVPTGEWLEALRMASLRFGRGCSASFVSRRGLIMTNHHCVRDEIVEVQGEHEWMRQGFYAGELEDEVPVPGLSVEQLLSTEEVTKEVYAGVEDGEGVATATAKREANERRILERAREETPELEARLVSLYQGAQVWLYRYRVWDDIRLVCSPHLQIAHFGGDFDNFTYPRHCLDFAFVRAWVDGEPADTGAHYFRWSTAGVEPGELVFTTGNPGTTKRLLTMAQMEYLRDVYHPIVDELIDGRLELRRQLVREEPGRETELRTEILSWENAQKAYDGYWAGLRDESLMAQKERAEAAFRARIEGSAELAREFGGVWEALADVAAERRALEAPLRFQNSGGHPVLRLAERVVRARQAEEAEARERYGARARKIRERIAEGGVDRLDELEFVDHLRRARRWLADDDPWRRAVLGEREPEAVAGLLAQSPLLEEGTLDALLAGEEGPTAPALAMARVYVPLMDHNRAAHRALRQREEARGAEIGRALFAAYGTRVSPDATRTLRFSDGVVAGYPCNGSRAPHRTTFHGLFGRAAAFGGERPFDLPAVWRQRQDRLDLTTSMDLVSSNDIIGGNSGSPLVNAELEVVGLVFDGNIEMLPNRYLYRSELPRAVSVHVDGILAALRHVYDADRVVAELLGSD